MPGDNRRRQDRLNLSIPLRVQGYLKGGTTWDELSTTLDVSSTGVSFRLQHPVELGHVLRLTLALPKRLRSYDINETTYTVFALVRFVHRSSTPARIGMLFFGKYPPRGFQEHPDGRYLLPGDAMPARAQRPPADGPAAAAATASAPGAATPPFLPSDGPQVDRRSTPRVDVFLNFVLQQTDEKGGVVKQELTVADNVGRGGARVMTTLSFHIGDTLRIEEAGGEFATQAEVRNITRTLPGCERLHLRFVDNAAPERLLR